jgi:hypothetical protein
VESVLGVTLRVEQPANVAIESDGLYARLHRTQSDVEPDPDASIQVEA